MISCWTANPGHRSGGEDILLGGGRGAEIVQSWSAGDPGHSCAAADTMHRERGRKDILYTDDLIQQKTVAIDTVFLWSKISPVYFDVPKRLFDVRTPPLAN
jgi:hypothetical protein